MGEVVIEPAEPDEPEHSLGDRARRAQIFVLDLGAEERVAHDGPPWKQSVLLEDKTPIRPRLVDDLAIDRNCPPRWAR